MELEGEKQGGQGKAAPRRTDQQDKRPEPFQEYCMHS